MEVRDLAILPDIEETHEEDRESQVEYLTNPFNKTQFSRSTYSAKKIRQLETEETQEEEAAAEELLKHAASKELERQTASEKLERQSALSASAIYESISSRLDIDNDAEYDTDIEIDENLLEPKESDDYSVGTTQYKQSCSRLNIPIEPKVMDNLSSTTLNLEYQGLGEDGAKALAKSLLKNTKVEKVKLGENSITPLGCTFLIDMLCDNIYITFLDLSHNDVGTYGCMALQEMLLWNTTVSHLILSDCKIKDSDMSSFSEGIQRNEVVVYLDLSHNGICEDGAMLLGNAIGLNNSIEQLNLSWNHIRRKGAVSICKGLKRNYCVLKVDLSWNGLGYDGALALSQTLKTNKYLKELDVSSNRLTWKCATVIANGLKDNDNLELLKIGMNPLTMTGVLELLHAVSNDQSEVDYMGFEGIPISRKIAYLAERLSHDREFTISHGGVIDTEDVLGRKPIPEDDPLTRLMSFLNDRSIRPVDLFRTFEKDKDNLVTREQFMAGLKKALVPLETWEMAKVLEVLDKSEEGKINYRKLNVGIKEKKMSNKLKDNRQKRDEVRKRKAERQLLNPETSSSRRNTLQPLATARSSHGSSVADVNVNLSNRRASRISLNLTSQSLNNMRRPSSVGGASLASISMSGSHRPSLIEGSSSYLSPSHRNSLASIPNQSLAKAVSSQKRISREEELGKKLDRLNLSRKSSVGLTPS